MDRYIVRSSYLLILSVPPRGVKLTPSPGEIKGPGCPESIILNSYFFISGIKAIAHVPSVFLCKIRQYDHFRISIWRRPCSRHEKMNDFILYDVFHLCDMHQYAWFDCIKPPSKGAL